MNNYNGDSMRAGTELDILEFQGIWILVSALDIWFRISKLYPTKKQNICGNPDPERDPKVVIKITKHICKK